MPYSPNNWIISSFLHKSCQRSNRPSENLFLHLSCYATFPSSAMKKITTLIMLLGELPQRRRLVKPMQACVGRFSR